MTGVNALEFLKHSEDINLETKITETPIIKYARVTKVIDETTVVAEAIVRSSLSRDIHTVTLLNFSSACASIKAYPKVGDKVLLLFLHKHDPMMFTADHVENDSAVGYNCYSGVGVLMNTARYMAETVMSFRDGRFELDAQAKTHMSFYDTVAVMFCRAAMDSEDEQLISVIFGKGRPFRQTFLSAFESVHGDEAPINVEVGESSPVSVSIGEASPVSVSIGKTSPISIGIGEDSNMDITTESDINVTLKKLTLDTSEEIALKNSSNSLLEIGNSIATLGEMISELIDIVTNLDTVGSPASHSTGPVAMPKLIALKQQWDMVFK